MSRPAGAPCDDALALRTVAGAMVRLALALLAPAILSGVAPWILWIS